MRIATTIANTNQISTDRVLDKEDSTSFLRDSAILFSTTVFLFLSLVVATPQLMAQSRTTMIRWSGEARVRSEVDMRDFNQRTAANTVTLLRLRLGMEAIPLEDVRVFIQAQDSRVFGQERDATGAFNTLADSKNLDVHQGYIELKNILRGSWTLRLGRQELSYGNERMIGPVGWHNVGRSFDGGVLRYEAPSASVDFLAFNTGEVQPYTPAATSGSVQYVRDAGSDLYGLYATFKSLKEVKIDAYGLFQWNRNESVRGEDDLSRFTLGAYAKGSSGQLDYEGEVAYQLGNRRGVDVSAYLVAGLLGYSPSDMPLTRVAAGYEILSGTPTGYASYKSFDPPFATGHKFHGFMDYFINIPSQTLDRGLTDVFVRATLKISQGVNANVWVHHFSYQQSLNGESSLGQELDLVLSYRHTSRTSFEVGFSTFLPAGLMRQRFLGNDAGLWGYLTTFVDF